jgi:hypothetical protein
MSDKHRRLAKHPVEESLPYEQPQAPPLTDGPDLSETLRLLEKISRMPDIRFEKVQEMRQLIACGRFETDERINGTIKRLMEELGL